MLKGSFHQLFKTQCAAMRLADMLKRVAQFIRSVIPSDPWQLIFLALIFF